MVSRTFIFCAVVVAGLVSPVTAKPARTITYDLNADFSTISNPNGAWSFNDNNTPISTFRTFWWGEAGWSDIPYLGDGCIIKGNPIPSPDPWGNVFAANDWQPGDVMMHALSIPYGGDSTFLNVKWTSPEEGRIDITGQAWDGEIFPDRDVAWQLRVDGKVIAQRSSVFGLTRDDLAADFQSNIVGRSRLSNLPVRTGTVVEFRVITDTYYGHFLGINETIQFHSRGR